MLKHILDKTGPEPELSQPLLFARTPVAAKVLLDAGADIEASDDSGSTALMYAAREGRLGLFRMLLKAGADTGVRDTLGGTLLTVAADGANKPKMIKELIDVGLEVDARDNDGMTALMMAARWNSPQVVKALLEVGADVNAKLEASTTALTTDRADGDIFAAIIDGKRTDVPVNAGTTVLMLAALNNRKPDVVRVLLDAGSDVNARDEVGRTALMLAARWNTSRIIDTLLDAGADIASVCSGLSTGNWTIIPCTSCLVFNSFIIFNACPEAAR